jgi:hypothetical protein
MSNVTFSNQTISNNANDILFKLSRALKAAGWIYKSSSDGTNKDSTGDYVNDKWASSFGGTNNGTGASVTSLSYGVATLTGLSGYSATDAGQHWITLSGGSGGNTGTFKILDFISSSSVTIRNPNAVVEGGLTWADKIPLSDTSAVGSVLTGAWICLQGPSTIKLPLKTLAKDSGTVVNRFGGNQSGSTASITNVINGVATVTGLTNMTMASVGRILTISGAGYSANNGSWVICNYGTSSSVQICNINAVQGDSNNGSITWSESDQVKFIRGEVISQATTGTQGEVIGINFDYTTGTGYLVVMPRRMASLSDWNSSYTVTGSISGASVAVGGTPVEFVRELVLWLTNNVAGGNQYMTGYMQCVNAASENTSRFNYLAVNAAGCTATIAPGGGGTNNSFPTYGSYVFAGTGSAKTDTIFGLGTGWSIGSRKAQFMCADATYRDGFSADGSFICAVGVSTTSYIGFAYTRLDNQEDGDLDPYVMYSPSDNAAFVAGFSSRVTAPTPYASLYDAFNLNAANSSNPSKVTFRGYRRRGFQDTNDVFQTFVPGVLCYYGAYGSYNPSTGYAGSMQSVFLHNSGTMANSDKIATLDGYVMEPIWVLCYPTTVTSINYPRMLKGTCRWLRATFVFSSAAMDTYGSKSWVQLSQSGSPSVIMLGGPWDGTTTPLLT